MTTKQKSKKIKNENALELKEESFAEHKQKKSKITNLVFESKEIKEALLGKKRKMPDKVHFFFSQVIKPKNQN